MNFVLFANDAYLYVLILYEADENGRLPYCVTRSSPSDTLSYVMLFSCACNSYISRICVTKTAFRGGRDTKGEGHVSQVR